MMRMITLDTEASSIVISSISAWGGGRRSFNMWMIILDTKASSVVISSNREGWGWGVI